MGPAAERYRGRGVTSEIGESGNGLDAAGYRCLTRLRFVSMGPCGGSGFAKCAASVS